MIKNFRKLVSMKKNMTKSEGQKMMVTFILTLCSLICVIGIVLAYKNTKSFGFGNNDEIIRYSLKNDSFSLQYKTYSAEIDLNQLNQIANTVQRFSVAAPPALRLSWQILDVIPSAAEDLANNIQIERLFSPQIL